ncbi:hypothetical protein [Paracoccus sp. (in: a-proteobacteria)]|uniref:hypothetical protein n=1 Tax=Paracoccus sp. TaxID=267 RepID=UPI0032204811
MRRRDGPPAPVLLALCGLGFVLFNFPLLLIWDRSVTLFGLPLLPLALFLIWGGLILVLALIARAHPAPPQDDPPDLREAGE